MDFKLDESYTPKTVALRVGNSIQDMKARRSSNAGDPSELRD